MSSEVVPIREGLRLPALIERAGPRTLLRFVEFFTVHIANANTRQAYTRALQSFLGWCQQQGVNAIAGVQPLHVAGYREVLRLQGYSAAAAGASFLPLSLIIGVLSRRSGALARATRGLARRSKGARGDRRRLTDQGRDSEHGPKSRGHGDPVARRRRSLK